MSHVWFINRWWTCGRILQSCILCDEDSLKTSCHCPAPRAAPENWGTLERRGGQTSGCVQRGQPRSNVAEAVLHLWPALPGMPHTGPAAASTLTSACEGLGTTCCSAGNAGNFPSLHKNETRVHLLDLCRVLRLQGVLTLPLCLLQPLRHLLSQVLCPLETGRETSFIPLLWLPSAFLSLRKLVSPSSCRCCDGGTSWGVHASARSSTSPPSSASPHTELCSPPRPPASPHSETTLRDGGRKTPGWDVLKKHFCWQIFYRQNCWLFNYSYNMLCMALNNLNTSN